MTEPGLIADEMGVEGFLADSVTAPGDGKLYVQGGVWNVIQAAALPVRQARIGLAVIIRVPYRLATNEHHRFEVRLVDEDEKELPLGDTPAGVQTPDGKIRRFGGDFAVGRPHGMQPGDEQFVTLAINLDGILFERAGVYTFGIAIDGNDAKRLRFRVNHAGQPTLSMG